MTAALYALAAAAEIFGAKPWTRFTRITLPLLKPSLQSALILRTVLAFEVFAVVYALAGRNFPVLVGEAYNWQGAYQNNHVAAAYALLILGLSIGSTLVSSRTYLYSPTPSRKSPLANSFRCSLSTCS